MAYFLTAKPRVSASFWHMSKRQVHNSPSYPYLRLWQEKGVDYVKEINRPRFQLSPQRVKRVLQLESAMKQKGFVPFVHAAPAGAKVPIEFYRIAQGKKDFFVPLRSPWDERFKKHEEAIQTIPQTEVQSPRADLLSVSYALTGNTTLFESAASWGFVNHFGSASFSLLENELTQFMRQFERREGCQIPRAFFDRGKELIRGYNRLKVGQFYVLGVPKNRLSRWVYDAKPYSVPTHRPVEEVAKNPAATREGTIATLVVSQETLDPTSGLVVVDASDAEEEARFCRGMKFSSVEEFPLYRYLLPSSTTQFEEEETEAKKHFDTMLQLLSMDFRHWLKTGEEPVLEREKIPFENRDFSELFP